MERKIARWIAGMRRPRMARRLACMTVSILCMGLCVAVFDLIGLGTDPCSCMNLGISRVIGMSFGTWQMLLNAMLLLLVIRYDPQKIGVGTIMNMVLVGYTAEFFMGVFAGMPALHAMPLGMRLLLFVPTMALFLLVASIYMAADVGVVPYDAVPMILAARTKKMSFRAVRMCWDVGALAIGFTLGATVGLVTLVTGFGLGPVIDAVGKRVQGLFEA